ncbi:MAG: ASCH domain-containing protein [Thermodesulfobacteriota bacterium]
MDKRKNRNVIALAINPIYAHAIFSGDKTVEFRRNGTPTIITHIVVYSTNPDQMVLGYCEVCNCVEAPPEILWRDFGKYGFIYKDDFFSYYQGYSIGKCYLLKNPRLFIRPLPLAQCQSFSKAPQSFVYVTNNEWKNIKRKKTADESTQATGRDSWRGGTPLRF